MNLSISSTRKLLITHNWKYFLGRNINSKLDHLTSWREWKIGTAHGENRCWTSDIYTEKTPDFRHFKYSFNKRSLHLFLLYPWKNEKFNQNVLHWTITLITPLFRIVHFKTNYNYRLSNHCFINELILVTYALISNAIEKTDLNKTNSTNLYPPTNGYLRETCKSQNINPIYLSLSSPSVSFRS